MGRMFPEDVWGVGALCLGICLFITTRKSWTRCEIVFGFGTTLFWGLVFVPFAYSSITAMGTPVYGMLFVLAASNSARLINNYKWSKG